MPPTFKYPPDQDLRRLLRFEPDSGAIWLGDTRMVRIPLMADTHSTPIADSVPPMADTWYKCPE